MNNSISIDYALVWQFKEYPHYQITRCKKIFNVKTGKQVKMVYNNGSIGLWIGRKWINKNKINKMVMKIQNKSLPF